jgi:succinate dehydrogenase/fumarate reductase-like Fe-S protein
VKILLKVARSLKKEKRKMLNEFEHKKLCLSCVTKCTLNFPNEYWLLPQSTLVASRNHLVNRDSPDLAYLVLV